MSKHEAIQHPVAYKVEAALIPTATINAVLSYLQNKPYGEVHTIISAIRENTIVINEQLTPSVVDFIQKQKTEEKK